jgi:threonine dehydrogenase-like Zn-dependent dehydrogenase
MQAVAVNPSFQQVGLVEIDEPALRGPTQVRIRMLEVGVCGTDKEICRFEYGTPPPGSEYLVLGHEALGIVEDAGPDVTRVKQGDLVAVMVRRPCHHESCAPCRAGRQDFCATGDYVERGIDHVHGFMTRHVVDEQEYLCPIPGDLRDIAVLTEPLTIAEKGLQQVRDVQDRLPWKSDTPHRAVVLGAGPVGLLGAMALKVRGFDVYVYSREPKDDPRVRLVEAMGATYISSTEKTADQLAEQVGNIDLIYEATGVSSVSFDVLRVLGVNGVCIFTGIPGLHGPAPTDVNAIMRGLVLKNQLVFGTVNANRPAFENAIADLGAFRRQFPEAIASLISKRWTIAGHADLLLGRAGGIKNVISL